MFDLRPVGYVVGLLVLCLSAAMLAPMVVDLWAGNGHWSVFALAAILTGLFGGGMALGGATEFGKRLSLQQIFLITTSVWLVLPIFGALPFIFGATESRIVDAYFEAMSGITTTGSTVLIGLEDLPAGLKLWRGLLQWIGGIGIIVVAMVFLPELRVGGMQIFRSESFDTFGKILPRAAEIARNISVIYFSLTALCAFAYFSAGQPVLDAVVHAMTTIATGGFANADTSFTDLGRQSEYTATVFMVLAALPFVRYVQLLAGEGKPLFKDSQIHVFLCIAGVVVICLTFWRLGAEGVTNEIAFRKALFNTVSLITGTGYSSDNYSDWGGFGVSVLFFVGLIGGCAGSTSCSIKVFRYQILFSTIGTQIRRLHSPHGLFRPKFSGRPISDDVLNSVMAFFVVYIVSLGGFAVALAMTDLDFVTALSGAAAALANIGPGFGDVIGPTGTFEPLNDTAKWILIAAMYLGRLELLAVFAILTRNFWRG